MLCVYHLEMNTNSVFIFLIIGLKLIGNALCDCPPTVYSDVKGFQTGCRLRCNCKYNEQCDPQTGKCPSGCLHGWMGPACQYRNYALKPKRVVQESRQPDSRYYAQKAIDGNRITCSRTGISESFPVRQWWKIEFHDHIYILGLVIKIQESAVGNFRGFTIEVGNDTNTKEVCYQHGTNVDGKKSMTIYFEAPIVGNVLEIKLAENVDQLELCEVEIFGGRLISFNKPTFSSDVLSYYGNWDSSYAVDGRQMHSGENQDNKTERTCMATISYNQNKMHIWSVNLNTEYFIQGIDFFGRFDKLDQFTSYQIYVNGYNTSSHSPVFTDDPADNDIAAYNPKSVHFTSPLPGWKVQVKRDAIILVICEVEVFGECPVGKCGWDCKTMCMCKSQTTGLAKIEGFCPHGCLGRWTGHNGSCNIECSERNWGPSCNEKCGNCINDDPCSVLNGTCPNSCKPGWIPPLCIQECINNTWGEECNSTCGHCKHDHACNNQNGECTNGCSPGYKPPMCSQECDNRWYGENCTQRCGKCLRGAICNFKAGFCPAGCDAGYEGDKCQFNCSAGFYGINCSETCGNCAGNDVCLTITGECPGECSPGWMTSMCNKTCDQGYFGVKCNQTCGHCLKGAPCSHSDGKCPGGCEHGYYGNTCNTDSEQSRPQEQSPIGIIVGAIVAVLIILLIFLSCFIYKKKLKRETSKPSKRTQSALQNQNLEVTDANILTTELDVKLSQDAIYHNSNEMETNKESLIEISDLRDYCKRAKKEPSKLYDEFRELPYGLKYDASEARAVEYRLKNRYKDMYPYNVNRVVLPKIAGESASTYINASFIDGYRIAKKYIAAQGALQTTVDDIWRMVWSQHVTVIVMLTNLIELGTLKCVQYWPDDGSKNYADIQIELVSVEEYTDFKIRTFQSSQIETGEQRTVLQFHYTAWPDKGVPDSAISLVQFWRKVRFHAKANKFPWVVHCSAGIGRSGTFIAIDYLYDQGKSENAIDVKEGVNKLRKQRLNMVQTKDQYVYLHEAIAESLVPIGTVYGKDDFLVMYTELSSNTADQCLEAEFNRINEDTKDGSSETVDNIYNNSPDNVELQQFSSAFLEENIPKSRDLSIVPDNLHRPMLSMAVKGRNDFINAVFVPTYRKKDRMIITQFPLKDTVVDFVRMVWGLDIKTVVLLEDTVTAEGVYWPTTEDPREILPFKAILLSKKTKEFYTIRTVRYTFHQNETEQQKDVSMFHFHAWPNLVKIPENTASIIQLSSDIVEISEDSTPIIIQCLDGASKSGLLCILLSVLERMKTDGDVAMAETVRMVRLRRKQVIGNFEQYKFCHDIVRTYIETHDVYANVL